MSIADSTVVLSMDEPLRTDGENVQAIFQKRAGKSFTQVAPLRYRAGDVGLGFLQRLVDLECRLPKHPVIADAMGLFVARLLRRQQSTIATIICPDYSFVVNPDQSPGAKYSYTFESVGDGIGITAARAVNRLPQLLGYFEQCAPECLATLEVLVMIADHEGTDESNCCGLTQEEFRARCARSLEKVVAEIRRRSPNIRIRGVPTTQLPDSAWARCNERAAQIMAAGEHFGDIVDYDRPDWKTEEWEFILRRRRNFYARWYPGQDPDDCLRRQAIAYIASGLLCDDLPNCHYFGVDSHLMAPFMHADAPFGARSVSYMLANYA